MSTEQPVESPEQSAEYVDTGEPSLASANPSADASPPARTRGLAAGSFTGAVFAVLGSLAAWAVLELSYPVYTVPGDLIVVSPSPQQAAALEAVESSVGRRNSALALGLIGALLAGALAAGEGWARRSWKTAIAGFIGCALAGAFFGGLAGWAGHTVYQYAKLPGAATIDLEGTVVVQMTMLAVLGAGVGLVLGSLAGEAGSLLTRIVAGAMAGVLAGLVCPFATANLLPAAQTEHIVPQGKFAALLWLALTGVLLGMIIPGAKMRRTGPKTQSPAESTPADTVAADEG